MITVFEREEMKYMLDTEQYLELRSMTDKFMKVDEYGLTTIYSLYFDSPDNSMIKSSIAKPVYKEKLRLRSYGYPRNGDHTVFMELKKKFRGTVYKRRVPMTLDQANSYILTGEKPFDSQIMREIDYSFRFHDARPALMMCYDRIAMVGKDETDVRMTFDFNVRCRRNDLHPESGDSGNLLIPTGNVLLEVKILGAMPLWLAFFLSELKAYPTSFSKYGAYFEMEARGEENKWGFYSSRIMAIS
ncbi:MAG: polyphosphate polymerase domain-containing protein [Oscillospiraceae bacterium]|nr:polyphosphate polymerase domain-containing protein [Oscillospiraceae bacterium]